VVDRGSGAVAHQRSLRRGRGPLRGSDSRVFDRRGLLCAQAGDEEARRFTNRVVKCLDQVSDLGDVQDMLPLIQHHEVFAVLISKYARGLISPNGFRSIVSKRFTFATVRPWLEQASHERLARLAELVEREDFVGLRALLALPAA
jgi:hypothetical protein